MTGTPATVPEALRARASSPDTPYVIGKSYRLTFGEADRRSASLAAELLAAGVGKGTRLGILFPNSPDWIVAWLAATRIGALTVPLSTFSPGLELARTLRHADVAAILSAPRFGDHDLNARLEEGLPGLSESSSQLRLPTVPYLRWIHVAGDLPPAWSRPLPQGVDPALVQAAQSEVSPADPLTMIATSGTSASPKAVIHTHGSLIRHASVLTGLRGLNEADRVFCPMPFFWVGGLTAAVIYPLTSGAAAVSQERFEPAEALDLIERERVTLIQVWPNAARAMALHPTFDQRDLSSVQGGSLVEAIPEDVRPQSPDLYPGVFGMTETGGPHSYPDDPTKPLPEHLRGSLGKAVPGVERRIVNPVDHTVLGPDQVGELMVRGPFVMDQIYKVERFDTFTANGWYRTGDLCSLDGDGYLRFHGRKTSMIKTGGSNVAPAEVEEVLTGADGVQAAFVFGVAAGVRGEDVAAVVVPVRGIHLSTDELASYATKHLSPFKVPRRWLLLEDETLPMLPTGKVDFHAMRALFAGTASEAAPGTR